MPPDGLTLVCPACRGPLDGYECTVCARRYPVIAGIPDFRLYPDPYISLEGDREKAARLAASPLSFAQLVAHYYAITPDVPGESAARWMTRMAEEIAIAKGVFAAAPLDTVQPFLDLGCSTGAALIASGGGVGVDVALRWLVIAQTRLREAGVEATLICANAEALPFAGGSVASLYAGDLLEHLRDAPAAIAESRRLLREGAAALWTTNNRWSLALEPHVRLWGVGWMPRGLQAPYVALRRPDIHRYRVTLRGAREIMRLFESAGFREPAVAAAPLIAPHRPELARWIARYNSFAASSAMAGLAATLGPRLVVRCRR